MLKQKKENRSSELMEWFYNQEFDKDTEDRIKEKFTLWFLDNESEEKEEVLEELFRREFFNEDNSLRVPPEKKVEYGLLLDKYKRIVEAKKAAKRISLRKVLPRVAAVVLPLLIVSAVWFITIGKPSADFAVAYTVPDGVTKVYDLPDSSHVTVNSGSTLNISHDNNRRYAELTGESYFKVAKDEKRPFIVKTEDLTVTVLGTEFNVEAYPDQELTIVTLTKGRVSLETNNGEKWTLTPNQQLIYNKQTKISEIRAISNINTAFDWTTGKMICELKTMPEIFKIFERKFNINVEIDPDVHFSDMKYTTQFKAGDTTENIMDVLKVMTDSFDYVLEKDRVRIIKIKQ